MKKITLSLVIVLFASTTFCQSFMHGAGLTVMGSTHERYNNDFSFLEGLTYSPRFNFLEKDAFSVSVGIPLSIAISVSSNLQNQYGDYTSSVGIVFNIPVIVNLNMGRGSTKANRQKFGYFVGAGFGYQHGDYLSDYYDYNTNTTISGYSTNTFGPAANAGVRIGVGRKHKNIEIKLSYLKGLNETKSDIFGLACLYNF